MPAGSSERTYRTTDLTRPQPGCPAYAEAARGLGINSRTGILFCTDKEDFVALNLYARRTGTFTVDLETAGWILVRGVTGRVGFGRSLLIGL